MRIKIFRPHHAGAGSSEKCHYVYYIHVKMHVLPQRGRTWHLKGSRWKGPNALMSKVECEFYTLI
jgi:hypothetical protein